MTTEQAVQWLRAVRYCPTMSQVARTAGIERHTLYEITLGAPCSEKSRRAIEQAAAQLGGFEGYQNRPPPQPQGPGRRSAQAAESRR